MSRPDADRRQVSRRQLLGVAGFFSVSGMIAVSVAVWGQDGYGSDGYGEEQYGS